MFCDCSEIGSTRFNSWQSRLTQLNETMKRILLWVLRCKLVPIKWISAADDVVWWGWVATEDSLFFLVCIFISSSWSNWLDSPTQEWKKEATNSKHFITHLSHYWKLVSRFLLVGWVSYCVLRLVCCVLVYLPYFFR